MLVLVIGLLIWRNKKLIVIGNFLYKKISSTPFISKSSQIWTNCKLCTEICPVGAIDKNNVRIVDTKNGL